jgi:hypothetical protein
LLNIFRHKNTHLVSILLIAFAILARMLVPIAHASNESSNKKGFLASLCTGNKIVFVEVGLPTDNAPQPTVFASSKCLLCNIIAQDPVSDKAGLAPFLLPQTPHQYTLANNELFHSDVVRFSSIRAPPTLS